MSWSRIRSGHYERPLGETEQVINLFGALGRPAGRENWAVSAHAGFKPTGTLKSKDLTLVVKNAWQHLRFQHPSIAVTISNSILSYDVPDKLSLDEWTSETFHICLGRDKDDVVPSLTPHAYLRCFFFPEQPQILLNTAHWRIDGIGMFHLLNDFLDLIAIGSTEMPENLEWGQEVDRLVPSIETSAQIPEERTPEIIAGAQKMVETFAVTADAVGIPYKGNLNTTPQGTRSACLTLSEDETLAVIKACKKFNITVTTAVHASLAAANYALAIPERKNKHFSSTIRHNLRTQAHAPWDGKTGASAMCSAGVMIGTPSTNSWMDNIASYTAAYKRAIGPDPAYITPHREYGRMLRALLHQPPPVGAIPPSDVDISSFGVVEKFISRQHGDTDSGLDVLEISIGVDLVTRQMDMFVWTYRDKLNFNTVYNEAYHSAETANNFNKEVQRRLFEGLKVKLPIDDAI